jgi:hypothetical protein
MPAICSASDYKWSADTATPAPFILRHEPGWSQEAVEAAMASREGIRFFADVYHHDAELAARLQEHRYAHWTRD